MLRKYKVESRFTAEPVTKLSELDGTEIVNFTFTLGQHLKRSVVQ